MLVFRKKFFVCIKWMNPKIDCSNKKMYLKFFALQQRCPTKMFWILFAEIEKLTGTSNIGS